VLLLPAINQGQNARTGQLNPVQNENATQGGCNSTQQVIKGLGDWLTIQRKFNKQQQNKAKEEETQSPTIKTGCTGAHRSSCNSFKKKRRTQRLGKSH